MKLIPTATAAEILDQEFEPVTDNERSVLKSIRVIDEVDDTEVWEYAYHISPEEVVWRNVNDGRMWSIKA